MAFNFNLMGRLSLDDSGWNRGLKRAEQGANNLVRNIGKKAKFALAAALGAVAAGGTAAGDRERVSRAADELAPGDKFGANQINQIGQAFTIGGIGDSDAAVGEITKLRDQARRALQPGGRASARALNVIGAARNKEELEKLAYGGAAPDKYRELLEREQDFKDPIQLQAMEQLALRQKLEQAQIHGVDEQLRKRSKTDTGITELEAGEAADIKRFGEEKRTIAVANKAVKEEAMQGGKTFALEAFNWFKRITGVSDERKSFE